MEKSVVLPAIGLVTFTIKVVTRTTSTTVMLLDEFKHSLVSSFEFFRRAEKQTVADNFTQKAGKKEAKKIKRELDLL